MSKTRKTYSVSEINNLIKVVLEDNLPSRVTIAGELSNWRPHASGHRYFILKDENAQLPAVMWKSSVAKLKFSPENGLAVFATGHIDVYPPHGKYQFVIDSLQPAGVGDLQLAFEQMVKKLTAEGLFDEQYKQPLPAYPMRIGILTSESGAAVHDIADSIHNRWPCAKLFLHPVPVQGKGSEKEIASAIRSINKRNADLKLDILIVGRGGGSMEDLWPFNEEVLARAIFDSEIPIISAVGHEIDVTITDLVADARASTPTKAGVIAVPDAREVLANLRGTAERLKNSVQSQLVLGLQTLKTIQASSVFRNPLYNVQYKTQQLDELVGVLKSAISSRMTKDYKHLEVLARKLSRIEPHRLLSNVKVDLERFESGLKHGITKKLNRKIIQLTAAESKLGALNPKSVLTRGYSITTLKSTGELVKDPDMLKANDEIVTEFSKGKKVASLVKSDEK